MSRLIRLSHDYGYDVGNLHIVDWYMWRHRFLTGVRWQSPRSPTQRDHDEEISGAYR